MNFRKRRRLIVYTKGKYRNREEIFSDAEGRLKDIELVVLINEGSWKKFYSEIVSGCIRI